MESYYFFNNGDDPQVRNWYSDSQKGKTMITADEARKRISDKIEVEAEIWLENTEKKIEEAIACKKRVIWCSYQADIFDICQKALTKLGYKVEKTGGFDFSASEVKVSWE